VNRGIKARDGSREVVPGNDPLKRPGEGGLFHERDGGNGELRDGRTRALKSGLRVEQRLGYE